MKWYFEHIGTISGRNNTQLTPDGVALEELRYLNYCVWTLVLQEEAMRISGTPHLLHLESLALTLLGVHVGGQGNRLLIETTASFEH